MGAPSNQSLYYIAASWNGWRFEEMLGPDEMGAGFNWNLSGDQGDFFKIEFRRSPGGADERSVTWEKKGVREVDPSLLVETNIGYSLLGSCDDLGRQRVYAHRVPRQDRLREFPDPLGGGSE